MKHPKTQFIAILAAVTLVTNMSPKTGNWGRAFASETASETSLTGMQLCTWDRCLDDNRKVIDFLKTHTNKTVTVDFEIDIPIGAGDFQSRCYGKLVRSHPHEGKKELIVAVLPTLDQCTPPNSIFLRVNAQDVTHLTAVTGQITDRVAGQFTITEGAYDGSEIYTLIDAE